VGKFFDEKLAPALKTAYEWLNDKVGIAVKEVGKFFDEKLAPALKTAYEWLNDKVGIAVKEVSKFFDEKLLPALKKIVEWLGDRLNPLLGDAQKFFDKLGGESGGGLNKVLKDATDFFDGLADKVKKFKDNMPSWLIPGSPTPMEIGLRGLADALLPVIDRFGQMALELGPAKAKAMESVAKSFRELVKALTGFAQALQLIQQMQLQGGGRALDLGFLDQYEEVVWAVLTRIQHMIDQFGRPDKQIKDLNKAAKRIRETLDAVIVDLSGIRVYDLPDLATAFAQVKEVFGFALRTVLDLEIQWGENAIEKGAELASTTQGVLGFVKSAIDAVVAMASYKPVDALTDKMTNLKDRVLEVLLILVAAAANVDTVGTQAAATFYQAAQGVVSFVKPAIDALVALAAYQPVDALSLIMPSFRADVVVVITELVLLAAQFTQEGVDSAAAILQAANQIVGVVKPAIEALKSLTEYEQNVNLVTLARALAGDLGILVSELLQTAVLYELTGVQNAGLFAQAATQIVGVVKPAIEALAALAEYEPRLGLLALVQDLRRDLSAVVTELKLVAEQYDLTGVQNAGLFAQAATQIVGLIKPAIEAVTTLGGYVAQLGTREAIQNLALDLLDIVTELGFVAGWFELEGVQNAGLFAQATTQLIGLIKPTIDALTALGSYTAQFGTREAIQNLALDLLDIVTELKLVAEWFELEGIQNAGLFAQAATQIAGLIKPAIEALTVLGGYTAQFGTREAVQNLALDLIDIVTELKFVAGWFELAGVQDAGSFAQAASQVIGLIKPTLDALTALLAYENAPTDDQIGWFTTGLERVIGALHAVATRLAGMALDDAVAFGVTAKGIIDVIKPAIDALVALLSYNGSPTDDQIGQFTTGLERVVGAIRVVAERMAGLALDGAVAFSSAAKSIVDFIKPSVEALTALVAWEPVTSLKDKMDGFQRLMGEVVRALIETADCFELEGVQAAGAILTALTQIVTVIKPGIEALAALATWDPVTSLKDKMDGFQRLMGQVTRALIETADGYKLEGLQAAGAILNGLTQIIGFIKPGMEAITALLNYQGGDVAKAVGKFQGDLATTLKGLGQVADQLTSTGVSHAARFQIAAETMTTAVTTGVGALAGIEGTTPSASSSLQALAQTATGSLQVAVGAVTSGLAAIRSSLSTNLQPIYQLSVNLGAAIGQGIVDGINSYVNRIRDTLVSAVQGAGQGQPLAAGAGAGGGVSTTNNYNLTYQANRAQPGYNDATRMMREIELETRSRR
jgi:hypothetical protein